MNHHLARLNYKNYGGGMELYHVQLTSCEEERDSFHIISDWQFQVTHKQFTIISNRF